uniref:Uncharacterized protein n=1 Tax=Timema douglasi TaxID=61478 RepID=A0A7R8VNF4_TIMDO|nr:unnamed protein product [Timema douglasi]
MSLKCRWQLYGFSILSFLSLLATEPSDSPQSALGPFHGYTTVLGVRGTLKPPDLVTDEVKQILEGENIPSSCPLEPDELNSACVECQEILEPLQSTLTFLDASGSTFEDNSRPTQEQPLQNILEKLMIGLQSKENNSTSIQGLSFANSQLTSIPYKAFWYRTSDLPALFCYYRALTSMMGWGVLHCAEQRLKLQDILPKI